jgi:Haem-binding domain
MKVLALTIALLMLALIGLRSLLLGKPIKSVPPPKVQDYRYTEPFRGSRAGNTVARACGDCHSNQTNLPWYGHIVPISWWIGSHVREGRQALDFSEWTTYSVHRRREELQSFCGIVSNGTMPLMSYRLLHPEARLTAQDKEAICVWANNRIEQEK